MRFRVMMMFILGALLLTQPIVVMAGSHLRLIPSGVANITTEGAEVKQIRSEVPLPQGAMIGCEGNCVIQARDFQLVASDKTTLAVSEEGNGCKMALKSGRVDLAMRAEAGPIMVNFSKDSIKIERLQTPEGTNTAASVARGYVVINENGLQVGVEEGELQVSSASGSKLVKAGSSITLASTKEGGDMAMASAASGAVGAAGLAGGLGSASSSASAIGTAGTLASGAAAAVGGLVTPIVTNEISPGAQPPNPFH